MMDSTYFSCVHGSARRPCWRCIDADRGRAESRVRYLEEILGRIVGVSDLSYVSSAQLALDIRREALEALGDDRR